MIYSFNILEEEEVINNDFVNDEHFLIDKSADYIIVMMEDNCHNSFTLAFLDFITF